MGKRMEANRPQEPSPWESEVVSEWRQRARTMSGKVYHLNVLGMGREDLAAELELKAALACRTWARRSDDKPPDSWIWTALRRYVIDRIVEVVSKLKQREGFFLDGNSDEVEDLAGEHMIEAVDLILEDERRLACNALVHAIRCNVTPAAFELLHLRYVVEHTPQEIAEITGVSRPEDRSSGQQVCRKLYLAKGAALEFLESLSIYQYEDGIAWYEGGVPEGEGVHDQQLAHDSAD